VLWFTAEGAEQEEAGYKTQKRIALRRKRRTPLIQYLLSEAFTAFPLQLIEHSIKNNNQRRMLNLIKGY